ncbi:MAG TPA: hypothetical protein VHV74_25560 [Pseudonocardiaceae bacterium]|nr:hypothetical protein [Pseudonocardiaceae bacterium]
MPDEQLRQVIEAAGPFASVYLDASHDTFDAPHQNELRWQAARTDLVGQGADDATLRAIDNVLGADAPAVGKAGRAVIAAGGQVVLDRVLPVPPATDLARFSDLPYLVPLFALDPPSIPYVVVVAGKAGGTMRAVDGTGRQVADTEVQAEESDLHRMPGAGRAAGSLTGRIEEAVRQNGKELAQAAAALVERTNAELLVLAGDVQARSAVRAGLPAHVARVAADLDDDAEAIAARPDVLTESLTKLLAETEASRESDVLDRLHTGEAHGTARQGLAAVLAALRIGQVDTVLLTDQVLGDATVWRGGDHTQVAADRADLPDAATQVRADEAVPVAAFSTSAGVLVLAPDQASFTDGIAAVLRYA